MISTYTPDTQYNSMTWRLLPEGHGEPHGHHHEGDSAILWSKALVEISPDLLVTNGRRLENVDILCMNLDLFKLPRYRLAEYHGSTCCDRLRIRIIHRLYHVPVSDWISISSSSHFMVLICVTWKYKITIRKENFLLFLHNKDV